MLQSHFHKLRDRGTGYVSSERIQSLNTSIKFYHKNEDKIGLQLSDLAAYPIARHVIDQNRANPAFDLIYPRFYNKDGVVYGLKVVP